jgi:hypothetical protein
MKEFIDVPDPVKYITLDSVSSDSAKISWKEPNANNSDITGYQFTSESMDPKTLEKEFHCFFNCTKSSHEMRFLTPDQWYSI